MATRFCVLPVKGRQEIYPEAVERWVKLGRPEDGDIAHAQDIDSKSMDGRDGSFVRVCELLHRAKISKLIYYFYVLADSVSDLWMKTGGIKTFPKSSRLDRLTEPWSSSPFPEAKKLFQRIIKMFVLWSFGRFIYTILRNCQGVPEMIPFYSRCGGSNPTDIKSVRCALGGVEDWERSTAAAR